MQLGGSVFLSVGQNIFSSQLVDSLSGITGLDTSIVPPSELGTVVNAYSYALTRVFILTATLSA